MVAIRTFVEIKYSIKRRKMNVRIFKTTNAIYETFNTLLREKNFDKISVNEICKKSLIK